MKNNTIGQIKENNELSERQLKFSKLSHEIANQAYKQIWNHFCIKFNELGEMTGDEILSYAGTMLSHIAAGILERMITISKQDDTGYTKNQIVEMVFIGIMEMHSLNEVDLNKILNKSSDSKYFLSDIKRIK